MTHPMPATTITSPVEYTLGILEDRLDFAEEETQKLTKQLVEYGFQRLTAEKPDENSEDGKECKRMNGLIENTNDGKYRFVVSRLCQTESIIQSMRDGIQSIEDERSVTKAQLIQEKDKIQECYAKEIQTLKTELENNKLQLSAYATMKSSLEKQIEKLKKELSKKIDTQRKFMSKVREKDSELNAFQEKLSQLTKESGKQQGNQRKLEEVHSSMILKISELEAIVETERMNVSKLNQKCESLANDALLARQEFETELNNRLQLENLLTVQEEDFESSNKKMEELLSEMNTLKHQNEEQRGKLKILSTEKGKLSEALGLASSDNKKLKESLRKTVTDRNALIENEKDSLTREKCRVESLLTQQNKVLDCTKDTFISELDKQRKQTEEMQSQNLKLSTELHETKVRIGELEFKTRLMQQNHEGESKQLHAAIATETKMKDEALDKMKVLDNDINEKSLDNKSLSEQCASLRTELDHTKENYAKLESKHAEVNEKLLWMAVSKESNDQMKQKMTDMIGEKNNLAYEKGALQTKVSQLTEDLEALSKINDEYNKVVSKSSQLESELKLVTTQSKKMMEELRAKDMQLKIINSELGTVKGKISQTQTNYQNVQKKNIELTKEIQQLLQKLEDVTKKYEDQIKVLKGRVSSSTQEQQNASEHFRSLMSTNDQLQQQLQTLQESLGKKDFQLHNLLTEREKNIGIIEEMQTELDVLNKNLDLMEDTNKDEVTVIQQKLKATEEEYAKLKRANANMKSEMKSAKTKLSKVESRLKDKDGELRQYIESKEQLVQSLQRQYDSDVENLKKTHRVDVQKSIDKKLKTLNEEKKKYVDKNTKQAELLGVFMKQVSGLQDELSTIVEEQNVTTSLLKEKDDHIKDEKRKRKEIEQKYKVMLRKTAANEILQSRRSLGIVDNNDVTSSRCVERNLIEEKLQTQDAVKKYQRTLEKEQKKIRKLEEDINCIHRIQKKKPRESPVKNESHWVS